MAELTMDELLKKIGWTDGTRIPVANEENQKLEETIAELNARKHRASFAYENAESRFNALSKHLKYLHDESDENQKLLFANKDQLDKDQHNFRLKQCERDKIRRDIKISVKSIEELDERYNNQKTVLERGVTKIEKLKAEAAWDTEALKSWDEALKKRDEDNELLKKFSKQDEKKAKDLEAKRMSLQVESNNIRAIIKNMVAELTNFEQVMDRTGRNISQLKEQKDVLIRQWQETVRSLRQRDDEIRGLNKDIETAREVLVVQKNALQEQETFLQNEIKNNKELVEKIDDLNEQNSKIRRHLNSEIEHVLFLNNELNTTKREMLTTAQRLEKERTRGKMLTKDIHFKDYQINKAEKELDQLRQKYSDIVQSSMSSADRAKQLELMIEFEQKQINVLACDLTRSQNVFYRTQQRIGEYKEAAKTKEMEISGLHTTMQALRKHRKKIVVEMEKAKELIYDIDFRKCQTESKLSALEGTVTDDAMEDLVMKIKDLQSVLAKHKEIKQLLQSQITRLSEEMRLLTNKLGADNLIIEEIRNKLQNLILLYEGGLKQAAAAKALAQKKQVEENVLRLKVDNLGKGMQKQEKQIYNLQKFRVELDNAMKERQIEIRANKEILFAKKRNLDEELGRLRADIMGRNIKIDHLQRRYQISLSLLGKDEDGQPLSITHFKLRTAQEKYFLQTFGDELDTKIRTAEKEIVAMENTLKVVNFSNASYKSVLSPLDEKDTLKQEMKDLQQELQDTERVLRDRKKLHQKRLTDLKSLKQIEDVRNSKVQELLAVLQDFERELDRYTNERADRLVKISRVDKHLARLYQSIKNMNVTLELKHFDTKNLQSCNNNAIQQLKELALAHEEVNPIIKQYYTELGLTRRGSIMKSRSSIASDDAVSFCTSSSNRSTGNRSEDQIHISQISLSFGEEEEEKVSFKSSSRATSSELLYKKSIKSIRSMTSQKTTSKEKIKKESKEGMEKMSLQKMIQVSAVDQTIAKTLEEGSKLSSLSSKSKTPSIATTEESVRVPSSLFEVVKEQVEEEIEEEVD